MTTSNDVPRWNLDSIYPGLGSRDYAAAVVAVARQTRQLAAYMKKNHIAPGAKVPAAKAMGRALGGYIMRRNALSDLHQTVQTYVALLVSADSFDAEARRAQSEVEMLGVPLANLDTLFSIWLKDVKPGLTPSLTTDAIAQAHTFALKETVLQSRFMMSAAEEKLANELAPSGVSAWSRLQGTLVSQLKVPFEFDGKTEVVSMPALINIGQHDASEARRRAAYQTENASWDLVKETLAAAMNGVKGNAATLARLRGRKDALSLALDINRVDRATLDAMMGAIQDAFPVFRRYFKRKAERFGSSNGLQWWNLFAPVTQHERHYSWNEARDVILQCFAGYGKGLTSMTQRAFDERWIDGLQRTGKRAGAFCADVPLRKQSRILCNFDGSLDQVSTIAHELGHAYHNECMRKRTPMQANTPMALAETASIFCETIVGDALYKQAGSDAERLSLLETDLIGASQVTVDISSRFLFERELFSRRAHGELSADDLCAMMLDAQDKTYGDGLDPAARQKYMWTWKPHYYSADLGFYNWPYAFGLLFATGLYAMYQAGARDFHARYDELLSCTGMDTASRLAARFGINIRKREFWDASLAVIGRKVDAYCAL